MAASLHALSLLCLSRAPNVRVSLTLVLIRIDKLFLNKVIFIGSSLDLGVSLSSGATLQCPLKASVYCEQYEKNGDILKFFKFLKNFKKFYLYILRQDLNM